METSSESPPRKPWTAVDVKELRLLVKLKRPVSEIADVLGRTPRSVTSKIVSLRPARKPKAAKKTSPSSSKKKK